MCRSTVVSRTLSLTCSHNVTSTLELASDPRTMSDPPPRKVGSLRDRIAAFENKGAAPAPAPPPPRPKPGHVTWQPKPASPTSPRPPPTTDNDDGAERKPGAGMSAADAQQSIGKLSLKERMAALQGSTAFGGPAGGAGGPPPRPAGEKPKWKPPPVVQRVEPIGGEDEEAAKPAVSPPATTDQGETAEPARSPADEGEKKEEGAEGEPKEEGEPDPEDEERQRRAALAARMARLGGARVGMGPPIFGKKPDVPPKRLSKSEEKPKEEEVPKEEKLSEVSPPAETVPEGARWTSSISFKEINLIMSSLHRSDCGGSCRGRLASLRGGE